MARPTRIDFPGALFHVIARGNQRQRTFRDAADYAKYEALLERYQQRAGFPLFAYVLMPNHVHLLLERGRLPLAKVMQGLQQSYTAYFNRRYRLVGHCFQGRYKAILCDRDAYLLMLVRYLHLNPVRSGLVKDPAAWRWSSHGTYLGRRAQRGVSAERILGRFSQDPHRARAAYRRFVAEGAEEGHREDLYEVVAQQYLGDEAFVEAAERKAGRQEDRPRVRLTVEQCLKVVAESIGVEPAALSAADRSGKLPLARAVAAHLGREVAGIPYVRVAQALAHSPTTLSIQVRRLLRRMQADRSLAGLVAGAEAKLRNRKRKV